MLKPRTMNLSPRTQTSPARLAPADLLHRAGRALLENQPARAHALDVQHRQPAARDGTLSREASRVRLAAIWTIPGLLVWFIYVVLAWGVFLTSTLAHVGGLIVAMIALRQVSEWIAPRGAGLLAGILMSNSRRASSRPRTLNVNLAHAVQPGWEQAFPSYWIFWLVLTASQRWCCGFQDCCCGVSGPRKERTGISRGCKLD